MSPAELELFTKSIPNKGKILEFGAGGSTQLFFEKEAEHLYSVESDMEWLKKIATNPVVQTYLKYKKWSPLHVKIGPIKEWGAPVSKDPEIVWLNYHQNIWASISDKEFDFVLVDGRFRVACICQTLLRCTSDDYLIAVHDFWNRPEYHVVLNYLDLVDKADTLGIFKPKQNMPWKSVAATLMDYQFVSM